MSQPVLRWLPSQPPFLPSPVGFPLPHIHNLPLFPLRHRRPPPPPIRSPTPPTSLHHNPSSKGKTRRGLFLPLLPILTLRSLPSKAIGQGDPLELYTDVAEGFAVLHPSTWIKVDKAGATVLFEDGKANGNNIGIVVNPVKLESLRDFGTPQFVAEKLIQAERRKDSTKDAKLMQATERLGHKEVPVYEFEYTVDSTRGGLKRIFSAAFVRTKKLYLLNIVHSDRPDSPLDGQTRIILEQVLHSFDAALQPL